ERADATRDGRRDRRPGAGRVPERGVRDRDRQRRRRRGRRGRAVRRLSQRGGFALPLRDRQPGSAAAVDRGRRRRPGVLGDRAFACAVPGRPVAHRRRARILAGRAVHPRVARRGPGGPWRRAVAPRVADPGWRLVRGGAGGHVTATPETSPPVDRRRVAWLAAGGLALVGGTLLGWNSAFLEALATPPALIRAALVAGAVVLGLWLLAGAVRTLGPHAGGSRGRAGQPHVHRPDT